ncbi:MAG: hypothetical protein NTY19_16830 [Planctomycetota bacterium]|nr:hypothetical protein [Planctomycetota bacterium]
MTAPALQGPWESPTDDFFDGGSLYAAKSVSDGRRRFLCGTLPRRQDYRDDGENGWAGRLLVYEIVERPGDRLGVRIPAEVEDSFGESSALRTPQASGWESLDTGLRSVAGQVRLSLGNLPARCLLSLHLTVPPTGRAGLWLGGDAEGKNAFRLFVDVGTQRLIWDRGALPLGSNPEKERPYRPLSMRPGERILLKVALDGNAAVACVNDTICLATPMFDRRQDSFGLWADTVGAEFHDLRLRRR